MTLQVVTAADAEHLFTTIRDSAFGWTVEELPALMTTLGWVIDEEIPGKGSIADTPWGVLDADVELEYKGDTVQSMTIAVTSRAGEEPADRVAVIDAFASLVTIATDVLGPPTATFKGAVPRVQWRLATATTTIQNIATGVLIVWCRNEFQDFNDSVGRY